jgi:hypothetical protein
LLEAYPTLLPTVILQACPAAAQQQQHLQEPAAAGGLAPEASPEHKHALGCLHIIANSFKQDIWHLPGLLLTPEELVKQLQSICWRWLQNEQLLRLILNVLQALVEGLLPLCAAPADDFDQETHEAEAGGDAAAGAAAGAKMAVGMCLRLLLVTLPGSSQVPLLIRGLALQVRLARCCAWHCCR